MLKLYVKGKELFNNETQEFIYVKDTVLSLEHSLVSISKWEAKWKRPYLSNDPITVEQSIDYIRCMTITQNVDPNVYLCISNENMDTVQKYIDDSMTATWFRKETDGRSKSIDNRPTTSEVIYYWMISYGIPVEFQKWHINRLLTLIRVCQEKNKPKKKRNSAAIAADYRALNAARRKKYNSKG